jgi:hypothetical protein
MACTRSCRATAILALGTLLASGPGCSYVLTEGPPPNHARLPNFDCSTSYTAPALDLLAASFFVIGPIASMSREPKSPDEKKPSLAVNLGVGLAGLALFAPAAVVGFTRSSRCVDAKDEQLSRPAADLFPPRPPPLPLPLPSTGATP